MPISDSYDDEPGGSGDVSQEQAPPPESGGVGPGTIAGADPGQGGSGDIEDTLTSSFGKRPSYADKWGPVLSAFDQRIAATRQAHAAAAQTQTLAEQTAQLATQRHMVAAQAANETNTAPTLAAGAQTSPGAGSQLPGNQPGTSLKDHLSTYSDTHFDEANAAHKEKNGKTADEMYDDMVKKGFVEPPDRDLTKREKSELFIHFGLQMLANRKKGTLESMGEAGQSTLDKADQMKDKDKQAAYAEFQRQQAIRIDQAKNKGETERTDITQGSENTRSAAERASREGIAKMEEEGRNAREKEKPSEKDKPTQYVDAEGYLNVRDGTRSHPVLDAQGNKVKAQRSAEDQARKDEADRRADENRQSKILSAVAEMKKDVLGSMIKDPTTGKRRAMTEQEMTDVATKRVDAAGKKAGSDGSSGSANPYDKFKPGA